jgi:hypothetical protein
MRLIRVPFADRNFNPGCVGQIKKHIVHVLLSSVVPISRALRMKDAQIIHYFGLFCVCDDDVSSDVRERHT